MWPVKLLHMSLMFLLGSQPNVEVQLKHFVYVCFILNSVYVLH